MADDRAPSTAEIVERSRRAVIEVRARRPSGVVSGSGFLVRPDGVAVTSLHLVRDASSVGVKLVTGETFDQVRVLAYDGRRDLVVLQFAGVNLPTLSLADSDLVAPGERIALVGRPWDPESSVSHGAVTGMRTLDAGIKTIQTDAAAVEGSSGSPLLNARGEVIGMLSFRAAQIEGQSFAMPSNAIRGLLSMEQRLTLQELARRLEQEVNLFDAHTGDGVTGTWKSLSSSMLTQLALRGDRIYGTGLTAQIAPGHSPPTFDLEVQDDGTYAGYARSLWMCSFWNGWRLAYSQRQCTSEAEIVFSTVDEQRIEGTLWRRVAPATGSKAWKHYCRSCGRTVEPAPEPFVWIRVE